ncbi:hypothetical protein E2562_000433, partial [Oryza meyeriana var. granulata]
MDLLRRSSSVGEDTRFLHVLAVNHPFRSAPSRSDRSWTAPAPCGGNAANDTARADRLSAAPGVMESMNGV